MIKNCRFNNVDSVFSQPFGVRWSCNRALDNITFEDCVFEGLCMPINITCPENEPLTFKMKNCKLSSRNGFGDEPVAEALNFRDIIFENVDISGYASPKIVYCSAGNIDINDSTPIVLEKGEKTSRDGQ